ncbi:MAG: YbhB/YbcL family Raf kinase inhibitor-like protein, partial [Thermoleophilaceae bacterium]
MSAFSGDGFLLHGRSPFPPIAQYAFLSDCESCALVAPSGAIEWLCLPRFDSPSIFGAMLDREAGTFRLGPGDVEVPAGRRYVPGTMVLETTWMTRTGWLIVRDALLIGPWHHDRDRSHTHRRSPTDHDADHVLLRTVKCVHGTVELHLDCEPVFEYGEVDCKWDYAGHGYHKAVGSAEDCDIELHLVTDLRLGFEGRRARARSTLHGGETAFVALAWSEHPPPVDYDEAYDRMERTANFWREWLDHGEFPDHPWRDHLQRSALTLKGLTYTPTGALIAAATTSLPENAGAWTSGLAQGKNDFGKTGYGGPSPPEGHGVHHYHFKLYALDRPLDLAPGATKGDLLRAMGGAVLEGAELVGTYERVGRAALRH